MNDAPIILHIDVGTESVYDWLKKNKYVIFSELIRYSEKLIKEDLEVVQAIMVSNYYDNIVFLLKKENLDLTLNKAMDYFLDIEEYEQCARIRNLFILIENLKNEGRDIKTG
jgi:hypothetical protein